MSNRREILAIIPARGGSKGVPRKNLAPLGGKPLIAHTIAAALQARSITRVVVSTEDQEIAEVARSCGAEVPFLRPAELADDHADLSIAINHTLKRLQTDELYAPRAVMLLYATSPFRTPGTIDMLAGKLLAGHQAVQTVRRIDLEQRLFYLQDRDSLQDQGSQPIRFHTGVGVQCFRPYGNVSGFRMWPSTLGTYIHFLDDPLTCIDIDTPEDLRLARAAFAARGLASEAE